MAGSIGGPGIWVLRDLEITSIDVVDQMTSTEPAADAAPQLVSTDGGSVTLLDLAGLRARAEALQREANTAADDAVSLKSLAKDLWVNAGRMLVSDVQRWSPAPAVAELLTQAKALSEKQATDSSELDSIHSREGGGIAGLVGKLGTWSERRRLSSEQSQLESQLRPLLEQIARQSPPVTLAEVDPIRNQAVAADGEAEELERRAASASTAATTVGEELKRRTDAEHEMGFDAPYVAAYTQIYGPQDVQSPLILKRGERAWMLAPATLSRQQTRRQWVGGSQGFSFPIGHTGIRYRVGSFHGHPVEQQFLGKLDSGTLVVTNQRIAFIGNVKSTSTPLTKLLHIECYSDAVAVFQEGRENPDFYFVGQPKLALFWINWALDKAST
jgi:hypothetical protein